MKVEIWSDVICPWCYVGKRRFEAALAAFPHRDEVAVRWRSFELDPAAPRERLGNRLDHLAAKYGTTRAGAEALESRVVAAAAEEGLVLRFDLARRGNTFDAHRLLHLAAEHGRQDALKERLLAGYFTEGEPIGDPDALARLAGQAGLPAIVEAEVLGSDRHRSSVRADEWQAQALGISGVPFFAFDRTFAVSGAQATEVFLTALERAWTKAPGPGESAGAETVARTATGTPAEAEAACDQDACALPDRAAEAEAEVAEADAETVG